jgi:two-component system NtrC family sensor kinase
LGGDILGVLMAVRSVVAPPFSPIHLERLTQLAPHVAIAVHNAQITSALRTSQAETMQANASLEQKVRERTEQISRAKKEWERTFDALDEPIALMDGFLIRRANNAYAKHVRLSVKDLPGKTCHRVFAGRDTPCEGCPLISGRGANLSTELEMRDPVASRSVMLRFNGYWMSDDVADSSVVVHYQDITQSKQLSERLRDSERLAAVGQLASGAAHEINNPLGFVTSNLRSLRGVVDEARSDVRTLSDAVLLAKEGRVEELLELLAGTTEPDCHGIEEGLAMIDESLDGARRVGDIVKGLRELSRLEIGKREPANVNSSITRSVRAQFGENAPNVILILEADSQADIAPLQLDQALGHVLKNALQATPNRQRVTIRTWCQGGEVVVQVRDEGLGIAKENLRRVFEPFFTTRGVGKGIGLGLTAAYGIVKRAGGNLEVESEGVGKGTTFTFKLSRVEAVAYIVAA